MHCAHDRAVVETSIVKRNGRLYYNDKNTVLKVRDESFITETFFLKVKNSMLGGTVKRHDSYYGDSQEQVVCWKDKSIKYFSDWMYIECYDKRLDFMTPEPCTL